MQTELRSRPRSNLLIKILSGVGEGGEDKNLTVGGIDGVVCLFNNDLAEDLKLCVAGRANLLCSRVKGCKAVAILSKVLLPAHEVYVVKQHLDLAPNQQALERGIVYVNVFNVNFFHGCGVGID